MSQQQHFGKAAEELAGKWLEEKGYRILHYNWRYRYYEIDIIATKDTTLHIVEVKARNFSPFGHPEDSVTRGKFKKLQRAADEYLHQHPHFQWLEYSILAITFFPDEEPEFLLLEDVYL